MKATRTWIGTLALLFLLAPRVEAQNFPDKPVTFVNPYPPGATFDVLCRAMAQELQRLWNQPILCESRAGAAAIIGTAHVAKAAPDGHTLLLASSGALVINPAIYEQLPYDPIQSFAPITALMRFFSVLVAHPSVQADTVRELVALAKAKPGSLAYGSFGNGSEPHLGIEQFSRLAGISLLHVPYKGGAPLYVDLAAGRIVLTFVGPTGFRFIQEGKAKGLAYAGESRSALIPSVPTFKEQGYDFVFASWWGLVAPAGTPRPLIDRIHRDVVKVITAPEFQAKRFQPLGLEAVGNTPEEFAQLIRSEVESMRLFAKSANIRADR